MFVDLSDCQADDEVGANVARALTADPSGAAQLLLVLDGCDAVSSGVAAYVRGASNAAGMHIVATCREPLGVEDEFILNLGPFSTEDAVKFYAGCVLEYAGGDEVDHEEADTIRRRVEELHAIPGEIELDVFSRRFRSLSAQEQRVLIRMSVFHSDCSWEAARAVCGDGSGESLQRLADASLLLSNRAIRRGCAFRTCCVSSCAISCDVPAIATPRCATSRATLLRRPDPCSETTSRPRSIGRWTKTSSGWSPICSPAKA